MQYGYKNGNLGELIKNYVICDNKIVINYLDGTNSEMPFTELNESCLLNKMLEQAIDRSNNYALYNAMEVKRKTVQFAIIDIISTMLTCGFYIANSNYLKANIMGLIYGLAMLIFEKGYEIKCDEIEELKKYDIYISIRKKLEKYIDNPNVFAGVEIKKEKLNINTLDNYSLKDMERIDCNVWTIHLKNYNSVMGNDKRLIKKITID